MMDRNCSFPKHRFWEAAEPENVSGSDRGCINAQFYEKSTTGTRLQAGAWVYELVGNKGVQG